MGGMRSSASYERRSDPVPLRRASVLSVFAIFRRGPFRMARLNLVGWAALLVPPALLGGVASQTMRRSPAVGALGGAGAVLAVAVVWDRWRWRNSSVSFSNDLDIELVREVAARLRAEGIDVTLDEPQAPVVALPASECEEAERWRLTTRQRWMKRVIAALDEASTPRPPH